MKRILLIILLILLAVLMWFAAFMKAPEIESNLDQNIKSALDSSKMSQRVEVTMNGRHAFLSGTTQSQSDLENSVKTAKDVFGGLSVDHDISILPIVKPYTMQMEKLSNGKVVIIGYAADTVARDAMIDHANKLFRRENVKTEISIAGDMPDADWPNMAMRGMNGLNSLILGQATLTDRSLKVTGTAENLTFIDQAREAVTKDIPDAYKNKGELDIAALPPIAKPFMMAMVKEQANGSVAVEGVTPDLEIAKAINEKLSQNDTLASFDLIEARGQPDNNWGPLALAVSEIPAKLVRGSVVLRDNQLFVQGVADTQADAEEIDAILSAIVPTGYEANRKITVLPPRTAGPVLSAVKSENGDVEVNATYVDESDKSRIEMLFGPSVATGDVALNLEQVRTEIPASWTQRLAGSADILTTLNNGSLTTTPDGIVVEGSTDLLTDAFNNRFANLPNFSSSVVGKEPEVVKPEPSAPVAVETETNTNLTNNSGAVSETQPETESESETKKETVVSLDNTSITEPQAFTFSDDFEDFNGFKIPQIAGDINRENCVFSAASIVVESKIAFNTGSANIDDASQSTLDKLAAVLRPCTAKLGEIIQIGGHTDSLGQDDDNMALSLARASSVLDALIARGVDQKFMKAKGFGETQPIANDNTAEGRAENRRIEFEIIEN